MIVRCFCAKIRSGQLALWQEKVENFSIPWLKAQRGLHAYYPGKPLSADSREFTMISVWENLEALKEAVGDDWHQVVLLEDEASLVEETSLVHYDFFDSP